MKKELSGFLIVLASCASTADVDLPPPVGPIQAPAPSPTPPVRVPQDRHWDCAGLDPADVAPLSGRVALTFDDGPHPTVTPQVLEILREQQIPATFFMLGSQLDHPEVWPLVEEIVADPLFEIGNHTWSHPNLLSLSVAEQEAEIDHTTALLESFGPIEFFRFPYGLSDCAAVERVRSRGMHVTGWHVDTVDWCYGEDGVCTASDYFRIPLEYEHDMLGFTLEQVSRFDGGVILMHDIHASTAAALPELIHQLQAEGYQFTSLTDLHTFPNLLADTPADLPFLGESCDPVHDQCWQIEYQSWCTPVGDGTHGVCTMACEGTCPDRAGAPTTLCATTSSGAGECVGRAHPINDWCARLPGTAPVSAERFVGSSGASPLSVDACLSE